MVKQCNWHFSLQNLFLVHFFFHLHFAHAVSSQVGGGAVVSGLIVVVVVVVVGGGGGMVVVVVLMVAAVVVVVVGPVVHGAFDSSPI